MNNFKIIVGVLTGLLTALTGVIGTLIGYTGTHLEYEKFEIQNRPYIVIQDIRWLGESQNLFVVKINSESKTPVNLFAKIKITTNEGGILFEKKYKDQSVNILPSEKDKTFFINYYQVKDFLDYKDEEIKNKSEEVTSKGKESKLTEVRWKIKPKTELEKEGIYLESGKVGFIVPKFIGEMQDGLKKGQIYILEIELHYGLLMNGSYDYTYSEKRYLTLGENDKIESNIIKKHGN